MQRLKRSQRVRHNETADNESTVFVFASYPSSLVDARPRRSIESHIKGEQDSPCESAPLQMWNGDLVETQRLAVELIRLVQCSRRDGQVDMCDSSDHFRGQGQLNRSVKGKGRIEAENGRMLRVGNHLTPPDPVVFTERAHSHEP